MWLDVWMQDWVQLLVRWMHMIFGIAWIGASFYFVWLDNHLVVPGKDKEGKGLAGELWAIHGGGFYEVAKYKLAPPRMPDHLHWFKWEAYSTWLSGMAMLALVYYLGAQAYLIDPRVASLSVTEAVALGLTSLIVGFICYEGLLRSPLRRNGAWFGVVLFALLTLFAWGLFQVFSPRGAYIHVGALIGTIMAGNVFLGIMPAQRALVKAVERGTAPDPRYGAMAKLRSTHNNYLTLPILFIMISNHYPFTYNHAQGWLVLAALGAISAFARHFFNLRHKGIVRPWILVVSFIALAAVAYWVSGRTATMATPVAVSAASASITDKASADKNAAVAEQAVEPVQNSAGGALTDDQAMALVQARCESCHAAQPTDPLFAAPPAGIVFTQLADIVSRKAQITTAVSTQYMPLANRTGMTAEERQALLAWLAAK